LAKAKKEKKIPVYKMKNGKLVKVDEVSHEEALKAVRYDEPDAQEVEAIYIVNEENEE